MTQPTQTATELAEAIAHAMLQRCRDYRSTAKLIRATEAERNGTLLDAKGRAILDAMLVRLRERLATFPVPEDRRAGE